MAESLTPPMETVSARNIEAAVPLGRVTVLDALAEETSAVSIDDSRRTTMTAGVDFEDD